MTQNEVKALIRQRMKDAEKEVEIAVGKRDFDVADWQHGRKRGLQEALQVIGMLDSDHNRLKSSL